MSLSKILAEFNKSDVKDITGKWSENYTIGFEFEIASDYRVITFDERVQIFENGMEPFEKWYNNYFVADNDISLNAGIEFITNREFRDLDTAIQCLEDFYAELYHQKNVLGNDFYFDNSTGIHINIGHKKLQPSGAGSEHFNLIKALLFLDEGMPEEVGIAYEKLEHRMEGKHSKPVKTVLLNFIKWFTEGQRVDEYREDILEKLESKINKSLYKAVGNFSRYKDYAFNLQKIVEMQYDNYVEFRYVGGDVSVDVVKEKLLYFCYIVELAVNENYKREEYFEKLFNFINRN